MKKVSAVVLVATIAFFIITSSSASIGKEYLYRKEMFGWPNKFFMVTYEKTKVTNLEIDPENMLLNYLLCLGVIGGIRVVFLFMKIKKAPLEKSRASPVFPVK